MASNVALALTVPSVSVAANGFDTAAITCTPQRGAVCPASYGRPPNAPGSVGNKLTATVPTMPVDSQLVIRVPATLVAAFGARSNITLEALPTGGQSLGANAVNVSALPINILADNIQYSVTAQRVASGPIVPGTQEAFDVTIRSTGEQAANLILRLTAQEQTGANIVAGQTFITQPQIRAISCLSASGGASCVGMRKVNAGNVILADPPAVDVTSSTMSVLDMPGTRAAGASGSSVVLRVLLDVPQPKCSATTPLPTRELLLNATIDSFSANDLATFENPFSSADNDTTAVGSMPAVQCVQGNLAVRSLTETAAQQVNGIAPLASFSYEAVYGADASNTGTANNVLLSFSAVWPGQNLPTTISLSPTVACVATGGAVCPSSYTVKPVVRSLGANGDPGKTALVTARIEAIVPAMPPGGELRLTFSGVSGSDDQSICRPRALNAGASISPSSVNFQEQAVAGPNPHPDNSALMNTTALIGFACGSSHEVAALISGPFLDRAGTQLAPQPLAPSQYVFFKSTYRNIAPGVDVSKYMLRTTVSITYPNFLNWTASTQSTGLVHGMVQEPAGPTGYSIWDSSRGIVSPDRYANLQTGVTCQASGGATCPLTPYLGMVQGNLAHITGWATEPYFLGTNALTILPPAPTSIPLWPVGGEFVFTSGFRVQSINPQRGATCVGTVATLATGFVDVSVSSLETTPASSERNLVPNSQSVPISVRIPPCNNSLAVTKTLLPPAILGVIPADGILRYRIVAQNTSAQNLDLPRMVDAIDTAGAARLTSFTCVAASAGAACPAFTPLPGTKRLRDGTQQPLDMSGATLFGLRVPVIDFVWGSPGASTMPAGSSVTFEATMQLSPNVARLTNFAFLTGDDAANTSPWPQVVASAVQADFSANRLIVQKRVSDSRITPGGTVTYTLDAFNQSSGDMVNPVLRDDMPAALAGTNPAGFANITCRPITAADNVMPGTVTAVACPAITSDATGLRAQFGTMPPNSGVRIVFTARAPVTTTLDVSNSARFMQNENAITAADSSSKANFVTRAIGAVQGTVWRDLNNDRNLNPGEPRVGGVRVEVMQNGVVVGSALVDPVTGEYFIDGLPEGTYDIRFIDVATGATLGKPKSADPSCASCNGNTDSGIISGVNISTGVTRTNQDLPLYPSGVVYDAVTRLPVGGATVTLLGPDGLPVPAACMASGVNPQTTSVASAVPGSYQMDVLFKPGCPGAGNYSLNIVPPASYVGPSALIPVNGGALNPSGGANCQAGSPPGNCLVQSQSGAPTGGQPTGYWFNFTLSPGNSRIVNNHIPLDPTNPPVLLISKVANKSTVQLGDNVKYTVKIRYASGSTVLPTLRVVDSMPAGFKLIAGTSFVSIPTGSTPTALAAANIAGAPGAVITYNIPLASSGFVQGQEIELTYRARAGVGAMQGDGINRAQAFSVGTVRSNIAQAKVKVNPGVFTSEACIVGKIYTDCNNNHMQDAEELGVPGVRLYLQNGTYLVSDSEGKYSMCGLEPKSHVLKVDQLTLPRGSRLTTTSNRNLGNADSLWLDLKNGEMQQADFAIGSCSNTVLEQVKARRAQGGVRSIDNERKGGTSLKFEGKSANYPDQGTDGANQPLVQPRPAGSGASAPPGAPPQRSDAENNTPVPQLPAASSNTGGNNIRSTK